MRERWESVMKLTYFSFGGWRGPTGEMTSLLLTRKFQKGQLRLHSWGRSKLQLDRSWEIIAIPSEDVWGEIRNSRQKRGTEKWKLRDGGSLGHADFELPVEYRVSHCKSKTRMWLVRLGHRLRSYHVCSVKPLRWLRKPGRSYIKTRKRQRVPVNARIYIIQWALN